MLSCFISTIRYYSSCEPTPLPDLPGNGAIYDYDK